MMRLWRRHRRASPALDPRVQSAAWQCVSLLLEYPEQELMDQLPLLQEVAGELPESLGEPIDALAGHLSTRGLREVQSQYVDTFDITRKCSLHLTFFTHGDTRKRGVALVQFKQAYRRGGVDMADEQSELPDHLSVLLEFGAACDPEAAWKLLNDHRVGIQLLHRALTERDSPWRHATEALRATLPELEGDDEQALRRLIAEGPPQEQVGLDTSPYGSHDPALDPHAPIGAGEEPGPGGPSGAGGPGGPGAPAGLERHADLGPTISVGPPR